MPMIKYTINVAVEVAQILPIMPLKCLRAHLPSLPNGLENARGLVKACEKRPVSLMQLEQIVDHVEQKLFGSLESEVSSKVIGELVMEQLRKVDEVAYVRFASVYRQFKDINTFMEELNTLLKDK